MTESKEKALSLKSDVTTVAVRNDVKETEKPKRKILDEDEYIEVRQSYILLTIGDLKTIHCIIHNHSIIYCVIPF